MEVPPTGNERRYVPERDDCRRFGEHVQYHHLVAVVDLQRREVRYYVDGQLADAEPINAAWQPWQANGQLVIGHSTDAAGNPVSWSRGDVDEVRVYQGAVADVTRIP